MNAERVGDFPVRREFLARIAAEVNEHVRAVLVQPRLDRRERNARRRRERIAEHPRRPRASRSPR